VGITTTWNQSPTSSAYSDPSNWSAGRPLSTGTAEFEASNVTNISVIDLDHESIAQWLFNPGATQYNFDIEDGASVLFEGVGITINSGSAHIFDFSHLFFDFSSSAGAALIDDFGSVQFRESSNAGTAIIHVYAGGFTSGLPAAVYFMNNSTGKSAQLITEVNGIVDFSSSSGLDGLGHVSAGSIAGAGIYDLGGDQLTVGSNGLSTEVSGPINDGGTSGNNGASLVKVGHGTLRLSHAGNTYSGGTILEFGKLDVAAVGAAGTGAITFAGRATLEIDNAALPGHHFGTAIDAFAKHDVIDLAGLKFHAGATATYHRGNHHLTVHSGTVTDTLTLNSPYGTHFAVASDGHGGTDVLLFHA